MVQCAAFNETQVGLFATGNSSNEVQLWNFKNRSPVEVSLVQEDLQTHGLFYRFRLDHFSLFRPPRHPCPLRIAERPHPHMRHSDRKEYPFFTPAARSFTAHLSEISCLTGDPTDQNIIASGSCDTTVKVWDLRSKKPIESFKDHTSQVNVVKFSPDGCWISSGSSDKRVNIWDIKEKRLVHSFEDPSGPVTCLMYNPRELKLASAGFDKNVKYFDLEDFSLDSETKKEALAIDAITFDTEGKYLFSASNDSLKIWRAEHKCKYMNSIPIKWKGVKDLKLSQDNKTLMGVSTGPRSLTLWKTSWGDAPASPMSDAITAEDRKYMDNFPKKKALSRDNVEEALPSGKFTESKSEKYNLMEAFASIKKEHNKFVNILDQKHRNLVPILDWLNMSNTRSALLAIEKQTEPIVLVDIFNMLINTKKVDTINIEFATIMLRKVQLMIESHYIVHIKTSMHFVIKTVEKFKTVGPPYSRRSSTSSPQTSRPWTSRAKTGSRSTTPSSPNSRRSTGPAGSGRSGTSPKTTRRARSASGRSTRWGSCSRRPATAPLINSL